MKFIKLPSLPATAVFTASLLALSGAAFAVQPAFPTPKPAASAAPVPAPAASRPIGAASVPALTATAVVKREPRKPFKLAMDVVHAAREDAVQRLGSGGEAVPMQLINAEAVTWPDGNLGCAPRPGIETTQALVKGFRARLMVGDKIWEYHASERGALLVCPGGKVKGPSTVPMRRD